MYKNTIPYDLNLQRVEELKKREEVVTNIPRVTLFCTFTLTLTLTLSPRACSTGHNSSYVSTISFYSNIVSKFPPIVTVLFSITKSNSHF